jgi:hypothetical protein
VSENASSASAGIGQYKFNFGHFFQKKTILVIRVTKLGEFSPIGRLGTLGSFLKTKEIARIFGLLSPRKKSCALILTKNGLGYILGDLFTNPSVTLLVTLILDSNLVREGV